MFDLPEDLRWSGILIALILLVISIVIIVRKPIGNNASLSLHFGAQKSTYILMGLFLTFAGAVFYSFIWFWLIPTYQLPSLAYVILVVSYIGQLLLSWWPASKTHRKTQIVHLTGGVIVASSMVALLVILSFNISTLPSLSGMYIAIGTIITFLCLVSYAFIKKLHDYFLIFELLFIAFFCTALVFLALKI